MVRQMPTETKNTVSSKKRVKGKPVNIGRLTFTTTYTISVTAHTQEKEETIAYGAITPVEIKIYDTISKDTTKIQLEE